MKLKVFLSLFKAALNVPFGIDVYSPPFLIGPKEQMDQKIVEPLDSWTFLSKTPFLDLFEILYLIASQISSNLLKKAFAT